MSSSCVVSGPQEALIKVASPVGEKPELTSALDTFHDHLQAEFTRQLNHCLDDDPVALAAHDVRNEAAVDLEHVEWQRDQIGEARVTGAEIVYGDFEPGFAQPCKALGDSDLVDEQPALGNFDGHPLRIDARALDLVEQPPSNPTRDKSSGSRFREIRSFLSGPSQTAAQRSALRWTSRDNALRGRRSSPAQT